MRALGNLKKREFYLKFIETDLELLIEGKGQSRGLLKGMTSNYIPVLVRGNEGLKHTMIQAKIREITANNTVIGTIGS
jgi:threonylcarbamoyladenosine tRNA methylthiotransferase MtaB